MSRRSSCHQFCSRLKRLPVARDELPQAGSVGTRIGHRVERAFDHRQQREFGRHAACFEFLDDVVQIGAAALDHAAQRIRPVQVPLLVVQGQVVVQVGHRETVAQTDPQIVRLGGQVDGARHGRGRANFVDDQGIVHARRRQRCCGRQHGEQCEALVAAFGKSRAGGQRCQGQQRKTCKTFDQRQNVAIVHGEKLLPRNGDGPKYEL